MRWWDNYGIIKSLKRKEINAADYVLSCDAVKIYLQDLTFEKLLIYYGTKGLKLNPETFMKNAIEGLWTIESDFPVPEEW